MASDPRRESEPNTCKIDGKRKFLLGGVKNCLQINQKLIPELMSIELIAACFVIILIAYCWMSASSRAAKAKAEADAKAKQDRDLAEARLRRQRELDELDRREREKAAARQREMEELARREVDAARLKETRQQQEVQRVAATLGMMPPNPSDSTLYFAKLTHPPFHVYNVFILSVSTLGFLIHPLFSTFDQLLARVCSITLFPIPSMSCTNKCDITERGYPESARPLGRRWSETATSRIFTG
jgi:hypothetical protein